MSGASYVVFGKASGFEANLNLSTLDGSNGFQINGELARDYSGYRRLGRRLPIQAAEPGLILLCRCVSIYLGIYSVRIATSASP